MQLVNICKSFRYLAGSMKLIITKVTRLLKYRQYDSSEYWRKRASEPDQAAVLWKNQDYNRLYRESQRKIIADCLSLMPNGSRLLDIGCGIGVVARMIVDIHPCVQVDAVDFPEMISVARLNNFDERITYIPSPAENYFVSDKHYDMIISSGCYSAIRNISALESALDKAAVMVKDDGIILMIDPFHRWNYLARTKYNSNDVIKRMNMHGLSLVKKSGVLFWPYREMLANSRLSGIHLQKKYEAGEKFLAHLGQHFWADYKILIFRK